MCEFLQATVRHNLVHLQIGFIARVQLTPEYETFLGGKSDISTVMHIYHAQHWIRNIFFSPTSQHFLILTQHLLQRAVLTLLDGVGQLL